LAILLGDGAGRKAVEQVEDFLEILSRHSRGARNPPKAGAGGMSRLVACRLSTA
jgi:hypothetical protein